MARPRKTDKPLTQTAFRLTEEELDLFRQVASSKGISVGQFLRSAGTAIAGDQDALDRALESQAVRDATANGAATSPPAETVWTE